MPSHELHVITTGRQDWSTIAAIAKEIWPYATAIHIREKQRSAEENAAGIQTLLEAGVPSDRIYINGHASIALHQALGGIHMPGDTPPLGEIRAESVQATRIRIGCSVHGVEEAVRRSQEEADYVMFGHIYATGSKPGFSPRGLDQLREVARNSRVPVIAIGGMSPERVAEVIAAGAAGVAVMSGIMEAADPVGAVKEFTAKLQR